MQACFCTTVTAKNVEPKIISNQQSVDDYLHIYADTFFPHGIHTHTTVVPF